MSAEIKKTRKRVRPTAKKAKVERPADDAAPVLFSLPDLTLWSEQHIVTPLLTEGYANTTASTSPPTTTPEPTLAKKSEAPKSLTKLFLASRSAACAMGPKVMSQVHRATNIPYLAPAGMLSVSLLVTIALIYLPWNGGTASTATSPKGLAKASDSKAPAAPADSNTVNAPRDQTNAQIRKPQDAKLPLKKMASQLDEQLADSEPTGGQIAVASNASKKVAESHEVDESFTEPWWRKPPGGHRSTDELAADAAEPEDEDSRMELPLESETAGGMMTSRLTARSAMRHRTSDDEVEESEQEEIKQTPSRFQDQDFHSEEDPAKASVQTRRQRATPESETYAAAEELPESPWRRIRNQRLEREPAAEEEVAERPASKKQLYRSPPGQEIRLDDEMPEETAARPRSPSKRSTVR